LISANKETNIGIKSKKNQTCGNDQYIIDAGQKRFGVIECTECGVIYQVQFNTFYYLVNQSSASHFQPGDASDEADHFFYHSTLDVLKFRVSLSILLYNRSIKSYQPYFIMILGVEE
jgi:hypothetical protein